MELADKAHAPNGLPFAGAAFVLQSAATGKFIVAQRDTSVLEATAPSIDSTCRFQFLKLPTGEFQIFSIHFQSFASAKEEGWRLFASVDDDTWSKFSVVYDNATGLFTMASTQPIAANSRFVSVVDKEKHLRVCEQVPRQGWSYFRPIAVTGQPVTNVGEYIP
jgi:hypothetical protein